MPDTPEPPLPHLSRLSEPGSGPDNDWHLLVETVPLYADVERSNVTEMKNLRILRSPFRSGTVRFSDEGVQISGMVCPVPPKWFKNVLLAIVLAIFIGEFATLSSVFVKPAPSWSASGGFIIYVFGGLSILIVAKIVGRRRMETKQFLAWESVRGMRIDTRLRFVSLVFMPYVAPPKGVSTCQSLSFNRLEPALVSGIAATVTHFAPDAFREETDGVGGVRPVPVIVLTAVAFTMICLVVVAILWSRGQI